MEHMQFKCTSHFSKNKQTKKHGSIMANSAFEMTSPVLNNLAWNDNQPANKLKSGKWKMWT